MKQHGLLWNLFSLVCGVLAATALVGVVTAAMPAMPASALPTPEYEVISLTGEAGTKIVPSCTGVLKVIMREQPESPPDTLFGLAVLPCPDGSGRTMKNLFRYDNAKSNNH